MAKWPSDPGWTNLTSINEGNEYAAGDGLTAPDLNGVVKNLQYLKNHGGSGPGPGPIPDPLSVNALNVQQKAVILNLLITGNVSVYNATMYGKPFYENIHLPVANTDVKSKNSGMFINSTVIKDEQGRSVGMEDVVTPRSGCTSIILRWTEPGGVRCVYNGAVKVEAQEQVENVYAVREIDPSRHELFAVRIVTANAPTYRYELIYGTTHHIFEEDGTKIN